MARDADESVKTTAEAENATRKDNGLDAHGFADIHRRYRERVLQSILGLVRDRNMAEDITGRAFQIAWEKRQQFRGDASPHTWIQAIARNELRSALRQERLSAMAPIEQTGGDVFVGSDHVSDQLDRQDEWIQLKAALDRLPVRHRRVLVGHFVEGLSVRALASREGVPYGTVLSRVYTAKRLLRHVWETQQRPALANDVRDAAQPEQSLPASHVAGHDKAARRLAPEALSGKSAFPRTYEGTQLMADDKVRKTAEDALNRLSAELEAGKSEALKNYLAAMGRFHRYSWGNVLLINSQRPDATRVAGLHTWNDLGRSVKKGEKGIAILAPVVVKDKYQSGPEKEDKQSAQPDSVFRVAGFRTAYVFDVSQTQGKPLPEFARTTGDPNTYGEKLKAVAANRGIANTMQVSRRRWAFRAAVASAYSPVSDRLRSSQY